jgi:hypothetical protein
METANEEAPWTAPADLTGRVIEEQAHPMLETEVPLGCGTDFCADGGRSDLCNASRRSRRCLHRASLARTRPPIPAWPRIHAAGSSGETC